MEKKLLIGENEVSLNIIKLTDTEVNFDFEGENFSCRLLNKNNGDYFMSINGHSFSVSVTNFENKGMKQIFSKGFEEYIKLFPKAMGSSSKGAAAGSLESPMPGKIFKVLKKAGETVKVGETILILEAMKMEHTIKATKDGCIEEIFFHEGEQVTGGAVLCAIE
jgi:3-methylcrotonyl-CoA carboxylase alpha subunit